VTLKKANKIIYLLVLVFFSYISLGYSKVAELRAIDRTTGRTYKLLLPINVETRFANLLIDVKHCYKNPIDKEIENYAYLIVKDILINETVFSGWMFSSSPSLSSLEHPINDIWLLGCKDK